MKNIYLDFDRTIYNTDLLYDDMNKIILKYGIKQNVFNDVKNKIFEEPVLFDYFKVVEYICKHNNISLKVLEELEGIVNNGDKYVYDDVKKFINSANEQKYKVNILTYGDRRFQLKKLSNLQICDNINNIYIASDYKYDLDLNYENAIFIDDNPRDLEGLYNRKAKKVIRISRDNTKYAKIELNNKNIESYERLTKIDISTFNDKGIDKDE